MKKRIIYIFFIVILVATMTIITGCNLFPSVNQVTVEMQEGTSTYVSQEVEIQPGTTLKWINRAIDIQLLLVV